MDDTTAAQHPTRGCNCASAYEYGGMSDRASQLAKVLIDRLIIMEIAGLDDAGMIDEEFEKEVRRDLVAKVLAKEAGLTDDKSISKVTEFLPQVNPCEPVPESVYTELAGRLRSELNLA